MITKDTPIDEIVSFAYSATLAEMFERDAIKRTPAFWRIGKDQTKRKPCVYWVDVNGEIVYVGQSRLGVRGRIQCHGNDKESPIYKYARGSGIVFWVLVNRSDLLCIENKLIKHFQPARNKTGI